MHCVLTSCRLSPMSCYCMAGGVECARYAAEMCFRSLACFLTEEDLSPLHKVYAQKHIMQYCSFHVFSSFHKAACLISRVYRYLLCLPHALQTIVITLSEIFQCTCVPECQDVRELAKCVCCNDGLMCAEYTLHSVL